LLIHFDSVLGMLGLEGNPIAVNPHRYNPLNVIPELIITTLVAFCAFILNYYIIKPFHGFRKTRYVRIIMAVVFTMLTVFLLTELFFSVNRIISGRPFFLKSSNLLYTFRDLFVGIVVLTGTFVIKAFYDRQLALIDNERLMRENLESQYESLKNQMSPHFLFNSLTALKTLITENPDNARLYLDHLSQVLRSTLQSNRRQSVCLTDELEVARSYIFLIKMRYEENLVVNFNVMEKFNNYRIPPLALQTLLENAIKHNEISKRNPLHIRISTFEPGSLVVTNSLLEKLTTEPGTGIGLVNLSRQYQLISGEDISISKKNSEFRVELPLLNPEPDDSSNR
jgi:sensor histidine kinase YesM